MPDSVCIIGDSVTGGVVYLPDSGRYGHCQDSFINLLGTETGAEIRNHSKFGCTVGTAFKQVERFSDDIAAASHTFIMLGGNDSDFDWPSVAETPEMPHDCKTPMPDFIKLYEELIARIKTLGGNPVLLNLIPVDGELYFRWFSKKCDPGALMRFLCKTESIEHWNEMYNIAVMKIAAKLGIPMIDVRSALLGARDFDGLFSEDGIHPSPRGHRTIFEYILPQAKKILI
ncbi:MAG: SGNH/GDSL hydrolase family protein [Clostridia bacterium]|nr:SGNH/GDSL hydrolase family protein [Clostridia bacterium]